jgi:hypothetical protein
VNENYWAGKQIDVSMLKTGIYILKLNGEKSASFIFSKN